MTSADEVDRLEHFGPCINCGREQTRNPHPNAGEPGHPEAGYTWHCVPCLEQNRHRWAERARQAEWRVAAATDLLDNCGGPRWSPLPRIAADSLAVALGLPLGAAVPDGS